MNGHLHNADLWLPGSVKGLSSQQLEGLDCHVILGNTYHLANRPGAKTVADLGGLHDFINWKRGMLTDSGGFQARHADGLSPLRTTGLCGITLPVSRRSGCTISSTSV